jgi:hypothetical protein
MWNAEARQTLAPPILHRITTGPEATHDDIVPREPARASAVSSIVTVDQWMHSLGSSR